MNSIGELALVGLGVFVVLKVIESAQVDAVRKRQVAAATAYYSSGGNAATPGYPDLLADGSAHPPAGAVWDETQGGYVLRDSYGNVTGVYT